MINKYLVFLSYVLQRELYVYNYSVHKIFTRFGNRNQVNTLGDAFDNGSCQDLWLNHHSCDSCMASSSSSILNFLLQSSLF